MAVRSELLVGRQVETELLAASLEASAREQPRFFLVAGEAGIGKTRLLREAGRLAEPLGLRVLSGTAVEGGITMPYLPLLAPLGICVEGEGGPAAERIRSLLIGESPRDPHDEVGAAQLVESIFAVLTQEPTLLLVDDVHWADASTLTLLDYVSHRARSEPLAVVVTARDDEPEHLARLPMADARRFAPLQLRRLTEDEVAEQIAGLLGRPPDAEQVSTVFARSAGNPFFVEQLLESASEDSPLSLRALVLRRLSELPENPRQAVEALAVVARPADEALVGEVLGVRRERAESSLREAAQRGITVPVAEGFAFRHPFFPHVILGELAGSTRRDLHRRVAYALAPAGAEPAEIATHWWETGDVDRAWASALEAAERAESLFAFAEARLHLERAIEVWPDGMDGRAQCLLRAADAGWLSGDPSGALAMARGALEEGVADTSTAQLSLASYAWDAGEHSAATAAFERAATLVRDDTPPATRSEVLWGLARARIGQGRFADARETAVEAAALAHAAGASVTEARSLFTVGLAHAYEGSLAGIDDIERGVALAVEAGSPIAIGHGFQFLTSLLHLSGALERAIEIAHTGVEACELVGLARSHGSDLRGRAALAMIELGRWDEADTVLQQAEPRALSHLAVALLAMRRGQLPKAQTEVERASVGSSIGGPGALSGDLELAQAELAWLGGDFDAARSALAEVEEIPGVWGAAALANRARLAARVTADDPRNPAPDTPEHRHPDPRLNMALRAESAAESERASGSADAELWQASAQAWRDLSRPYDAAYARLRHAEALFANDERGPAKDALREASAAASALGAAPLRRLAEDLARRARVSPDPPRRREPDRDEPTRRELDVLTLVADGLTNREIGARLFLSPKTVDVHVSRLLRKLDAHTRGEAVAVARRRGLLA
jgi:DNA-binding CsgD family transcriptional regulator/tetratricopeptide (TPR) repeat protein